LSGKQLTLQLTERALADFLPQPSSITPEYVIETVADFFGVNRSSLIGRSRARDIAFPRQVAMYLMRELGDLSLPRIGDELGGRDHTTVMYACEKVAELIETDDRIRRQILQLKGQLQSQAVSV
jgi:chromosomal replication initiator protein